MLSIVAAVACLSSQAAIAVPFSGVPTVLDPVTLVNSHGVTLKASAKKVVGESMTVLRNPADTERKVFVAIPRFSLGVAEPSFDVTAEMGIPDKSGKIAEWVPLSAAKAPQVADRIPEPDVVGRSEVDWGHTLQSAPLMVNLKIPTNGTRPLRIRFTTRLGSVNYVANNERDKGFRGAAYSMATDRPVGLLSGSISCGEGLFVPIPQANPGFEIGTQGTAIRLQNAEPTRLFMRLLLFTK
jgi:hypothetical protein